MKKQILFVHGGGEGAHAEDEKMAASLRDELGAEYDVHSPKMPNEDGPEYWAWKDKIANDVASLGGEVVLVGHSFGASILLKYLSEEKTEYPVAGLFSIAAPYWGAEDWEVSEYALKKTSRRSFPKGCRYSSITAATTNGCPSRTSRCTEKSSHGRLFASSMDGGISSTTISPRSLGTSKGCEEGLGERPFASRQAPLRARDSRGLSDLVDTKPVGPDASSFSPASLRERK